MVFPALSAQLRLTDWLSCQLLSPSPSPSLSLSQSVSITVTLNCHTLSFTSFRGGGADRKRDASPNSLSNTLCTAQNADLTSRYRSQSMPHTMSRNKSGSLKWNITNCRGLCTKALPSHALINTMHNGPTRHISISFLRSVSSLFLQDTNSSDITSNNTSTAPEASGENHSAIFCL